MTRKDIVATPKKTMQGKAQEVGAKELDKTTVHMLGIRPDTQVMSLADLQLVQHIQDTHDLADFNPMNHRYGPMSGISIGQRMIRAYRLGLLAQKK